MCYVKLTHPCIYFYKLLENLSLESIENGYLNSSKEYFEYCQIVLVDNVKLVG